MGVISEADKKILLERLAKAREAKATKKKALSVAAAPAAVPVPDVAPVAPAPAPASAPAVDELPPPLPDLVANASSAKKPKQKKAKVPESSSESDSDDEPVLPPKKKGKNPTTPYMKIKIYKDSPKALESIMHTIQANEQDGEETTEIREAIPAPPSAAAVQRPRTVCMTGSRPSTNTHVLRASNPLRDAALAFFS
jgi:hypothetical protein